MSLLSLVYIASGAHNHIIKSEVYFRINWPWLSQRRRKYNATNFLTITENYLFVQPFQRWVRTRDGGRLERERGEKSKRGRMVAGFGVCVLFTVFALFAFWRLSFLTFRLFCSWCKTVALQLTKNILHVRNYILHSAGCYNTTNQRSIEQTNTRPMTVPALLEHEMNTFSFLSEIFMHSYHFVETVNLHIWTGLVCSCVVESICKRQAYFTLSNGRYGISHLKGISFG